VSSASRQIIYTRRCSDERKSQGFDHDFITIGGKGEKLLREGLKADLKSVVKGFLEEMAAAEREAFCEQNEDVCNGHYSRSLDELFGRIDVRVPRTRGKVFRPFLLEPYKRTSYVLKDLVFAMYQGGCSTRDISRTVGTLIDGKYSAIWVSGITEVVREKVEAYRNKPIKKWYPIVFIDGTVINIRMGLWTAKSSMQHWGLTEMATRKY